MKNKFNLGDMFTNSIPIIQEEWVKNPDFPDDVSLTIKLEKYYPPFKIIGIKVSKYLLSDNKDKEIFGWKSEQFLEEYLTKIN